MDIKTKRKKYVYFIDTFIYIYLYIKYEILMYKIWGCKNFN